MLVSNAHASTIDWTLKNVTFNDGGVLTGTFSTDSASGDLLSYNLSTTAGSILGGFNFNVSDSHILGNNFINPNSFAVGNNPANNPLFKS
jgi:hypothetical protein